MCRDLNFLEADIRGILSWVECLLLLNLRRPHYV